MLSAYTFKKNRNKVYKTNFFLKPEKSFNVKHCFGYLAKECNATKQLNVI